MKRTLVAVLAFVVLACTTKKVVPTVENVDVVNGIAPHWQIDNYAAGLDSLAKLSPTARQTYMAKAWPNLSRDAVAWLSSQGRLKATVDSVVFHYGSAKNVIADDSAGVRHNGHFTDQLMAFVYNGHQRVPMKVLVQCLNGTFALADGQVQRLGPMDANTRFTIGRGEGLAKYVSYETAMMLAERHDLSVYRGKKQISRYEISAERGRALFPKTNQIQVSVKVYNGDKFDLGAGTYTPAPRPQAKKATMRVATATRHRKAR